MWFYLSVCSTNFPYSQQCMCSFIYVILCVCLQYLCSIMCPYVQRCLGNSPVCTTKSKQYLCSSICPYNDISAVVTRLFIQSTASVFNTHFQSQITRWNYSFNYFRRWCDDNCFYPFCKSSGIETFLSKLRLACNFRQTCDLCSFNSAVFAPTSCRSEIKMIWINRST